MMDKDWRYSDERMELRKKSYLLLLSQFGSEIDLNGNPIYSMKSITECAHDWVSQGNFSTDGLVDCYQTNYIK